jgi:hypothetical protein
MNDGFCREFLLNNEFRRWKYAAVQSVRSTARFMRGHCLTAADFAERAYVLGLPMARDERNWGQVMLEAQDLGYVRRSVTTKSDAPLARGRRVALWICL